MWVAEQAPVEPAERGTHRERLRPGWVAVLGIHWERIRPGWVAVLGIHWERITTVGGRP